MPLNFIYIDFKMSPSWSCRWTLSICGTNDFCISGKGVLCGKDQGVAGSGVGGTGGGGSTTGAETGGSSPGA